MAIESINMHTYTHAHYSIYINNSFAQRVSGHENTWKSRKRLSSATVRVQAGGLLKLYTQVQPHVVNSLFGAFILRQQVSRSLSGEQ